MLNISYVNIQFLLLSTGICIYRHLHPPALVPPAHWRLNLVFIMFCMYLWYSSIRCLASVLFADIYRFCFAAMSMSPWDTGRCRLSENPYLASCLSSPWPSSCAKKLLVPTRS